MKPILKITSQRSAVETCRISIIVVFRKVLSEHMGYHGNNFCRNYLDITFYETFLSYTYAEYNFQAGFIMFIKSATQICQKYGCELIRIGCTVKLDLSDIGHFCHHSNEQDIECADETKIENNKSAIEICRISILVVFRIIWVIMKIIFIGTIWTSLSKTFSPSSVISLSANQICQKYGLAPTGIRFVRYRASKYPFLIAQCL